MDRLRVLVRLLRAAPSLWTPAERRGSTGPALRYGAQASLAQTHRLMERDWEVEEFPERRAWARAVLEEADVPLTLALEAELGSGGRTRIAPMLRDGGEEGGEGEEGDGEGETARTGEGAEAATPPSDEDEEEGLAKRASWERLERSLSSQKVTGMSMAFAQSWAERGSSWRLSGTAAGEGEGEEGSSESSSEELDDEAGALGDSGEARRRLQEEGPRERESGRGAGADVSETGSESESARQSAGAGSGAAEEGVEDVSGEGDEWDVVEEAGGSLEEARESQAEAEVEVRLPFTAAPLPRARIVSLTPHLFRPQVVHPLHHAKARLQVTPTHLILTEQSIVPGPGESESPPSIPAPPPPECGASMPQPWASTRLQQELGARAVGQRGAASPAGEEREGAEVDAPLVQLRSYRLPLASLVAAYRRRVLLRAAALELFFSDGSSVLLSFCTRALRDRHQSAQQEEREAVASRQQEEGPRGVVHRARDRAKSLLRRAGRGRAEHPTRVAAKTMHTVYRAMLHQPMAQQSRLVQSGRFKRLPTPTSAVRRAPWTQMWVQGKLSNLEYLVLLNVAAGRSSHDLSQYPVRGGHRASLFPPSLDLTPRRRPVRRSCRGSWPTTSRTAWT